MKLSSYQLSFFEFPKSKTFFGISQNHLIASIDIFGEFVRQNMGDNSEVLQKRGILIPFSAIVGKVRNELVIVVSNYKVTKGTGSLTCLVNEHESIDDVLSISKEVLKSYTGSDEYNYFLLSHEWIIRAHSELDEVVRADEYTLKTIMNIAGNRNINASEYLRTMIDYVKSYREQIISQDDEIMNINPIFKAKNITIDEKMIFCALPFNSTRLEIFDEVIKPRIEKEFEMQVIRSGNIFQANMNIMESIWTYINQARIVIVDLSEKNPNVFYELGICHTLGKQVITICDEESLEKDYNSKLPFDIGAINTIFYRNRGKGMDDLVQKLNYSIKSVIEQRAIIAD